MKVAAFQVPIEVAYEGGALALIGEQVKRCERLGIGLLCCPEAVLGGLADYVDQPHRIAIHGSHLARELAPLTSDRVAVVLGFTERDDTGRLYNSAAVCIRGAVAGIYRKQHVAINRSIYDPGDKSPVFIQGALKFGILLCRDSLFAEPARTMVAQGARALLIPTNNGMPAGTSSSDLVAQALAVDVETAVTLDVAVIRADVVGRTGVLQCHGATAIVGLGGKIAATAKAGAPDLIVADLEEVEPKVAPPAFYPAAGSLP